MRRAYLAGPTSVKLIVPAADAADSCFTMMICPRKVLPMDDLSAAALAQLAYDRTEIAETFSRYAAGLDENDPELLGMALAQDCVLDFSAGGEKLGLDFPVLHGRAAVVEALIAIIGPLDTSHTASNLRVEVNGERATMKAFLMAQHYMPETAHAAGRSTRS
jgi:hypothetical protein